MPAMLRYRLIFGSLMLGLVFAVFYFDNWLEHEANATIPVGLVTLVALVILVALGTSELCVIFRTKGIAVNAPVVALICIAVCCLIYRTLPDPNGPPAVMILTTAIVGPLAIAMVVAAWSRRTEGMIASIGATAFAMIYLGLTPSFYLAIRYEHSAWVAAGIILITKTCDIGAYTIGRILGRHKLIMWLSPGKTWEGLVGGVLASAAVTVALATLGNAYGVLTWRPIETGGADWRWPLVTIAIAGGLIGLAGQGGDLLMSLLKRDAGMKDSGRSIPGHGGLLDVLDSPIAAGPVAYWLLTLAAPSP